MISNNFTWYIYVLDTNIDDLVLKFDFVGNFDDLHKKLDNLYLEYDGFRNINIKIIMK